MNQIPSKQNNYERQGNVKEYIRKIKEIEANKQRNNDY